MGAGTSRRRETEQSGWMEQEATSGQALTTKHRPLQCRLSVTARQAMASTKVKSGPPTPTPRGVALLGSRLHARGTTTNGGSRVEQRFCAVLAAGRTRVVHPIRVAPKSRRTPARDHHHHEVRLHHRWNAATDVHVCVRTCVGEICCAVGACPRSGAVGPPSHHRTCVRVCVRAHHGVVLLLWCKARPLQAQAHLWSVFCLPRCVSIFSAGFQADVHPANRRDAM
jgi:hypothetical protein